MVKRVLPICVSGVMALVLTLAYVKVFEGHDASWGWVTAPAWGGFLVLIAIASFTGVAAACISVLSRIGGK